MQSNTKVDLTSLSEETGTKENGSENTCSSGASKLQFSAPASIPPQHNDGECESWSIESEMESEMVQPNPTLSEYMTTSSIESSVVGDTGKVASI